MTADEARLGEVFNEVRQAAEALRDHLPDSSMPLWNRLKGAINLYTVEMSASTFTQGWNEAMVAAGHPERLITPQGRLSSMTFVSER